MPGYFLHNQFPNLCQTVYLKANALPSKQCPSKLYNLFPVLVFILSLFFSDLVLAFKACWPFYSLLAPFHHQTATWSFSFLLTKLLQQFPWPSRCCLPHHTQWANHLRALFLSHTSGNVHSYTSLPAACHLVLSTPSHLSALNPNRPLLSALTLPLFFFFFHKKLPPLIFSSFPNPTLSHNHLLFTFHKSFSFLRSFVVLLVRTHSL